MTRERNKKQKKTNFPSERNANKENARKTGGKKASTMETKAKKEKLFNFGFCGNKRKMEITEFLRRLE